jgi:hypothetical protein
MYAHPQFTGNYILVATADAAAELRELKDDGVTVDEVLDGSPGIRCYTVTENGMRELSKRFTVALAVLKPETMAMYKEMWQIEKDEGRPNVAPEWYKEIDTVS